MRENLGEKQPNGYLNQAEFFSKMKITIRVEF